MEVGTVDVTSDGTNIFVAFNVDDGWVLAATEVHIAGALRDIPQTRWGDPLPWWFMGKHGWLRCASDDAYTFPIGDLGGNDVYVVAHALVARLHRRCWQIADVWAGEEPFRARSRATYIGIPAEQWVSSGSETDISGDWSLMLFDGYYQHDLSLEQDADGGIVGSGALMAGNPPQPAQAVTVAGEMTDGTVTLVLSYTGSGGYTVTLEGVIGEDGSLSGTGTDGVDSWEWYSVSGTAEQGGGGLWTLP